MVIKNNQIIDEPKTLTATGSAPTTGSGKGAFYTKEVSGITEAFYVDSNGDEIQLTNGGIIATPPASGEANTASNLGATGSSVFKQKVGVDLQFRKIKAGTNVTVTENADDIEIAATGGGGGDIDVEADGSPVASAISVLNFEGIPVTDAGGGQVDIKPILTEYRTFDSGRVRMLASGTKEDLDAITATKNFAESGVSKLILNRPTTVRYHSIYVTFQASETTGRTECKIEMPEPNGATTLANAIRPLAVRYNPASSGVGATVSTISITGSTITLSTTGHTDGAEQLMGIFC